MIDRILLGFDRTAGLFGSILYTKLFAVLFLGLSCLGTKGVKEEKITWNKILAALAAGFVLFFFNWWLLDLPLPQSVEEQHDGRPFQQRERIVHAGDATRRERILGEPTDAVLL